MLNRRKLCLCRFHKHAPGEAHKTHKKCEVATLQCGHGDEDEDQLSIRDLMIGALTIDIGEEEGDE